ncbi:MAG: SET domain-containing protein-lysine N-methyltransferase, partial [Bacteroidota bacterium]
AFIATPMTDAMMKQQAKEKGISFEEAISQFLKKDRPHLDQTKLHDYYFIWGKKEKKCAIILGFGSIYNHSFKPNAEYDPDFKGKTLSFYALKKIKAGTEITVNYNGTPSEQSDLWFAAK